MDKADLRQEDDNLRARAWKEVRRRRERTHLAGSRSPGDSVPWDGNLESLISKWDTSGPTGEPMLLALQDSKYGQKIRQQVLHVPRWDKHPSPLDDEEKETKVNYAYDGAGATSTYKYISRKDVVPTLRSVTAPASSKAQLEVVPESSTKLKRKRTSLKVATEYELDGDLDHDDTSPLSAKRRCVDSNASDGGVASKREYRGGSGLVAKCHTTESQQNILNNKPADTANSSAPSNLIASEVVRHNKVHSRYRNASAPSSNRLGTLPGNSSHITPRRSHSEVHRKHSLELGFIPPMIEPSFIPTPKNGRPLTLELSGELKDRISAIFNTPLSAPAKLGWTKSSWVDGELRDAAPQGSVASRPSQGTGSTIGTPSGSSLPAIPGLTRQKKRAFDDGPGEEIPQGYIQSPLLPPSIKANHPSGYDLKRLEGIRRRAEGSPSPAARPPVKRKRMRM